MKGEFKLLRPEDFTPEVKRQVLDLGMESGIWQELDIEYYSEQFQNQRNINIVFINEDSVVTGYILAKPHNEAVCDYLVEDPKMAKSAIEMFYVDNVITDAKKNHASMGLRLVNEMIRESNRRGVSRFSLHARVSNGFSSIIQRKFNIDVVRKIEHYVDCNNEPFDYLEGTCIL